MTVKTKIEQRSNGTYIEDKTERKLQLMQNSTNTMSHALNNKVHICDGVCSQVNRNIL